MAWLVSRFDEWLAQGAQTYDVVDANTVRALAQQWVRKELQLDEERRLDPEQAFFLEHHEIAMYHMEPDYQALLALGGADKRDAHVVKTGDDLLREYQIRLDPQSSSYALLHRELVMGLLKVYEVAKHRNAGRVMSTHQAPEVDLSHLLKEPSNRQATHHSNVPAAPRRQAQHVAQPSGVPTLGELVDVYVDALKENEFKRKVRRALQLFAAVIGRETYVNEIRQKEVTAYLHKICLLPVNWSRRYDKGETVAKILTSVGDAECFSPTTFESNYRSPLGAFFLNSLRDYRDVGFPSLTVDGIEYKGLRKAEENKQRALSMDELKTLIEGPEFLAIANDRNRESLYWLTLVAFFLGARPREICQLNPQVDFGYMLDSWYIDITPYSAAGKGVKKTVKSGEERRLPLHSELVKLGFPEYLQRMQSGGADRLFPTVGMKRGNPYLVIASDFTQLLKAVGLYDDQAPPGRQVQGIYVARKTFVTHARAQGVISKDITGHADDGTTKIQRKHYISEPELLINKITELAKFHLPISIPSRGWMPTKPCAA